MRISRIVRLDHKNIRNAASKLASSGMRFPCLDKQNAVSQRLRASPRSANGNKAPNAGRDLDPVYGKIQSGYKLFRSPDALLLDYGGMLPGFEIAYETWGTLNKQKSNAILIHTGLSASSHAHSTQTNNQPGWWERFIGPGNDALDTNKWFFICTNVIGGCYGSTGPSSVNPVTNKVYATSFPMLSIQDIVRSQHRLIKDHFGIDRLYASIGSSMGGMQSLSYGQQFPDETNKIVSISACARSHPSSIAMRHAQRQVLMSDPNWRRGLYYPTKEEPNRIPPHIGMKLAREIATVTYRSGPEWESRFGSERVDNDIAPVLCPDFLVETYLDHQGEKFSLEYDANSFLYLSKTMDLFDLSYSHQERSNKKRADTKEFMKNSNLEYVNQHSEQQKQPPNKKVHRTTSKAETFEDLKNGMKPLVSKDILIIGVKSDGLFPYWQQRELVELLGGKQNRHVKHVELAEEDSIFGHDTFLLDYEHVGKSIGRFLREEL